MLPISTKASVTFYPKVQAAVTKARLAAAKEAVEQQLDEAATRQHLAEAETSAREEAMRDPGVCYRLKVPSVFDRIEYEAALAERGAQFVTAEELGRVMREGVKEVIAEDQIADCLAILDRYDDAISAVTEGGQLPADFLELAENFERIGEQLLVNENYPPYGRLQGRKSRAASLGTALRVQCFCLGAEGEGAPKLIYQSGALTQDSLNRIVQMGHLGELSAEIFRLMFLDGDVVGNSASPAPSTLPGQATSQAASSPPTAAPAGS